VTLTATEDLLLPATVTGSWPRPTWYTMSMWGRPLDTAMLDPQYQEQLADALAVVVSDQERCGLDILTTGDYHLDADVAGRSWHHYPLQRWSGLEHDVEELQTDRTRSQLLSYAQGTLLNWIFRTWRWPRVVDRVAHDPKNPLEYAKIWRIAQQCAASGKPVKFGTCSAQILAPFLDSHTPHYDLDDKKQLIWDMSEAMNLELRQLAAAGCRVIQMEEPLVHSVARYSPDETELIDFLVDAYNREVEGLDDVEIWIHTCWGNPMMQNVFSDESYANSVEIYLERMKGDVWTIEATENDLKELPLLKPYADSLQKKIAVGVVSHRTLQSDFPEVVADRIRRCLEVIPADKLILSTDCGFGRQGLNRPLAFYKAAAIPQARNIVLRELGLEERYVPCADETLAWDMLPDHEQHTHLKPLRSR
jgi:5-methyltetrahydropteroyltriglutamate--homocysteine methyltransferase